MSVNYGRRLANLADANPDADAYLFLSDDAGAEHYRWSQLHQESESLAREFAACGVRPGDAVAIALENCREHVAATWAAWKTGAWVVPLRADIPSFERQRIEALAGVALLVAESTPSDEPLDFRGRPVLVRAEADAIAQARVPYAASYPTPAPIAGIPSGGSTGAPKLVVLNGPGLHRPGEEIPRQFREHWNWSASRTAMISGPLYHGVAFQSSMWGALEGQTQVILRRFSAESAVTAIERYRVASTTLVPTMMRRILALDGIGERDLSSVVSLSHTGATCPEWVKRGLMSLVGPEHVFEGYGATEGVGSTSIRGDEWQHRPGSVGQPYRSDIEIRADNGTQVPAGTVGNVYLRSWDGPVPEHRYLGATALIADARGFVSVGDLGWLDEDGYLYIADRRVDLIITGGANVYPAEVEAVVLQVPGVLDCVVIGLPDDEWGQRVHAVVVASPDAVLAESDIKDFVAQRLLSYKVPKTIEVVGDLPRNEMGKINRSAVASARTGW